MAVISPFILVLILLSLVSSAPTDEKHQSHAATGERWGYVHIRPGAHTFWWLYFSTHAEGYRNRPLVMWLQGGPGASSCGYGNFELIGPLDLDLKPRNTTWVQSANILFVDNPVGAGYSYVDYPSAYTTTNEQIADDLLTFFKEFMKIEPDFQTIPFYIFGQSYGGKMATDFSKKLDQAIKAGEIKSNFKGYAMGNSWISPIDSLESWGPLLYWMSTIDEQGLEDTQRAADSCRRAIDENRWTDAVTWYGITQSVINQHSNFVDFYNILKFRVFDQTKKKSMDARETMLYNAIHAMQPRDLDDIMNSVIKEKLAIIPENVTWGAQSDDVFAYQEGDFMKPVVRVVDELLNTTDLQVIVYSGQLDLICETQGSMDWVQQLTWANLTNYNMANRRAYTNPVDRQTDTFVKAYQKFKFYWLLRGGHSIAKDQGETALRMLNRILDDLDK